MTAAALFGARLLEFNFLPSRTLHPSRHAGFGAPARPVPEPCAAAWHRHWSRDILRRLGLHDRPVRDAERPELALALLPPDRLARLARHTGASLCAPRLRRVIDGGEVRQLAAELGGDALAFARRAAPAASAAAPADALSAQDLPAAVDRLGRAALLAALHDGGPELVLRAELKLPDAPGDDPPCAPGDCLALALDVLKLIEPTWLSYFPATR